MTDKIKEHGKAFGIGSATGGGVAVFFFVLLQMGLIGPQAAERREKVSADIADVSARVDVLSVQVQNLQENTDNKFTSILALISQRLDSLDEDISEIKETLKEQRQQ